MTGNLLFESKMKKSKTADAYSTHGVDFSESNEDLNTSEFNRRNSGLISVQIMADSTCHGAVVSVNETVV